MKNILKILCALLLLCPLTGCFFSEDYQVMILDWSGNRWWGDLESGITVRREYVGSAARLENHPGSDPERVIQIAGEEKRCEYFTTKGVPGCNYLVHLYHDQDGQYISFDEDGNVVSCYFSQIDGENGTVCSMEEGLQIAKKFLSDYVDIEDYQIESESTDSKYLYSFTKYIGEYATHDSAFITVTHSGKLSSYSSTMLGRIPTDMDVSFNMDAVEEAIIEKLDLMYEEVRGQYAEIAYSIYGNKPITLGENGDPLLLCWVDISCIPTLSDDTSAIKETITFIVRME